MGENPRAEDLDVNITKEKKLTNMRSATSDATETLAKAKTLSLEEAMEFCAGDECVEVAPDVVRVRKVLLNSSERARDRSRAKSREQQAGN